MKPLPFLMENPFRQHTGSGDWHFWLKADMPIYEFVRSLDCIAHVHYEDVWQRAWVSINPLYDYEEAWLFVYSEIEAETRRIELDKVWEQE